MPHHDIKLVSCSLRRGIMLASELPQSGNMFRKSWIVHISLNLQIPDQSNSKHIIIISRAICLDADDDDDEIVGCAQSV